MKPATAGNEDPQSAAPSDRLKSSSRIFATAACVPTATVLLLTTIGRGLVAAPLMRANAWRTSWSSSPPPSVGGVGHADEHEMCLGDPAV